MIYVILLIVFLSYKITSIISNRYKRQFIGSNRIYYSFVEVKFDNIYYIQYSNSIKKNYRTSYISIDDDPSYKNSIKSKMPMLLKRDLTTIRNTIYQDKRLSRNLIIYAKEVSPPILVIYFTVDMSLHKKVLSW